MTHQRDLDATLDLWMSDGPTRVADRVIASALTEITTTPQRGASSALRRIITMTTLRPAAASPWRGLIPAAAAAMLILVVGVALVPRIVPTADGGPGLDADRVVTSPRYGYEITVPGDWTAHEVPGTWHYGSVPLPDFPGTDQYFSPASDPMEAHLFIWSAEAPAGTTLDAFLEGYDAQALTGLECLSPPRHTATTVAGADARLTASECRIDGVPLRLRETVTIADGRVFIIAMDVDPATTTDDELDALYTSILDTFRLTD